MAGGVNYDYHFLTSTEILTDDSDIWSLSNPLPRRLGMVKGVTSGGKLYFTGNKFCPSLSTYLIQVGMIVMTMTSPTEMRFIPG